MGNALFIIWRESAEAMLVVGILYAWLARQPDRKIGIRYLWGGVAAGIGLAVALALVMLGVARALSGDGARIFPDGRDVRRVGADRADGVLDAPSRTHAQDGPREANAAAGRRVPLVGHADRCRARGRPRNGRDGRVPVWRRSATDRASRNSCWSWDSVSRSAFATFWLLQKGGRALSWRWFFRVSEILLLLLAGGLLVTGIEKLIGLERAAAAGGPAVEHQRACLTIPGRFGGFVAAMTGYRAQPRCCRCCASPCSGSRSLYFLRDRRRPR